MRKTVVIISVLMFLVLTHSFSLQAEEIYDVEIKSPHISKFSSFNSQQKIKNNSVAGNLYVGLTPGGIYTALWLSDYSKFYTYNLGTSFYIGVQFVANLGGFYVGGGSSGLVTNVAEVGVGYQVDVLNSTLNIFLFGGVNVAVGVLNVDDAYVLALPYIKTLSEEYGIDIENEELNQDVLSTNDLEPDIKEEFINRIQEIRDNLEN